jgi:hypothetical protein
LQTHLRMLFHVGHRVRVCSCGRARLPCFFCGGHVGKCRKK